MPNTNARKSDLGCRNHAQIPAKDSSYHALDPVLDQSNSAQAKYN